MRRGTLYIDRPPIQAGIDGPVPLSSFPSASFCLVCESFRSQGTDTDVQHSSISEQQPDTPVLTRAIKVPTVGWSKVQHLELLFLTEGWTGRVSVWGGGASFVLHAPWESKTTLTETDPHLKLSVSVSQTHKNSRKSLRTRRKQESKFCPQVLSNKNLNELCWAVVSLWRDFFFIMVLNCCGLMAQK